jgi:hypothetical protein
MIKTKQTIDGVTEGIYLITTRAGSIYRLNLNDMTGQREPGDGASQLHNDGTLFKFHDFICVEGYSMQFDKGRISTPVESIVEINK